VVEEAPSTDEALTNGRAEPAAPADRGFGRHTAVMSVGTAASRFTGMLRVTATTAALGYFAVADTYTAANTTPNIVYELVLGGVLTSVFVPVFVGWATAHGRDASWDVAQRMLTIAAVGLVAIAAIVAIFAPAVLRLYLSASDRPDVEEQIELGAYFLRWFMPQIVFYGVGAIATGVLNAERRFGVPMFAPVLNNLTVIATMLVFIAVGDEGPRRVSDVTELQRVTLAAGTTLGVVAMTVALWPSLRRIGFRWRWRLDWRHPAIGTLLRLARWTVVYVVANQLAYLLVIVLNARIGEGALFAYAQAFIFFQLPHSIFAVSVFTALLPGMSERHASGDRGDVRRLWSRGIRTTVAVMLPAALGYVVLAEPILRLFADYGAARAEGVELAATALRGFAVGLPFFSAFQLLTRTSYAMQDARTPALVNLGAAVVNAAANVLLTVVLGLGVGGLALGHAASYVVGSVVLALVLRRRLGGLDGRRVASTIARLVPAAGLCAAAAVGAAEGIEQVVGVGGAATRSLQVGGAVTAGLLVFVIAALILRIEEVDEVRRALTRRIRR
jgi:putative peptidoglycan lipid II flippase